MATKRNTEQATPLNDALKAEHLAKRRETMAGRGAMPIGGGQGEIHKWEEGAEVEGKYSGTRAGKVGNLVDIQVSESEVQTWTCPKILLSRLEALSLGTRVNILCLGLSDTKSPKGNAPWMFDVYAFPG